MDRDIALLLVGARLLRNAGTEEIILTPEERFGIAKTLMGCGHFHFVFSPDMANDLAGVLESMALQAACLHQLKEGTAS